MISGRPTRRAFTISTLAAASMIGLGKRGFAQEGDILLGFNGDLSASPAAESAQAGVKGLQAAIDDVNAGGGVLGRKLSLIIRDDLSQPPKSIQNMSDLIDNQKVVAVFGPTNSGNAMAWRHIPNQKRIPVINSLSTGTEITKPISAGADSYIFRVALVDRQHVSSLLAYLKKSPATKNVGYLAETTGYGQGGLKDLQELGAEYGLNVVGTEKFDVNDTDMTSQLNKLRSAGVDSIAVWAQGVPGGQLLRSMEKIDFFPTMVMSWAAANTGFLQAAGPKLAEHPLFQRPVPVSLNPHQQQLFDRIMPHVASPTSFGYVAQCYDALMILTLAIKQAGSTDGVKVREALEDLQAPYEGYIKTYSKPFTHDNHEALTAKDYDWQKWKNGEIISYSDDVIKSLTPADFKS